MSEAVAVIGAGGHAKVVVGALLASRRRVEALFDDDEGKWRSSLLGVPVRGPVSRVLGSGVRVAIVAVGSNRSRRRLARSLDLEWVTVIHPEAWLDPDVEVGAGTVICAGAVIQPGSRIGAHVIVNTGATVDHDCRLADFSHLAPGVHLAGGVTVGEGALLGVASSAISAVSVGDWATIGAGAAVVSDIPAGATAVGVPARCQVAE